MQCTLQSKSGGGTRWTASSGAPYASSHRHAHVEKIAFWGVAGGGTQVSGCACVSCSALKGVWAAVWSARWDVCCKDAPGRSYPRICSRAALPQDLSSARVSRSRRGDEAARSARYPVGTACRRALANGSQTHYSEHGLQLQGQ